MLYVLKDTCIDWFLGYICLSEHNDFGSLEAYSIGTGMLKGFCALTERVTQKIAPFHLSVKVHLQSVVVRLPYL